MAPSPSSPGAAPLPPLPNLSGGGADKAAGGDQQQSMAALVSGIAPIKAAVDGILMACRQVVQSGVIPGSEQVCGQIVALATSLLPMAAQQVMTPMNSGVPPVGAGGAPGAGGPGGPGPGV